MKNEQERLTHLRLRQAQRQEIPWTLLKIVIFAAILVFAVSLAANCGTPRPDKPLTKAQKDENKQQLYGNQKKARNARLP